MKIISKGKILLLLSFSSVALISGGFSSWIISQPESTIQGQITVGDVITDDRSIIQKISASGFSAEKYTYLDPTGKNTTSYFYKEPLSLNINFSINKSELITWSNNNLPTTNKYLKISIESNKEYSADGRNMVSIFELFLANSSKSQTLNVGTDKSITGTLSSNFTNQAIAANNPSFNFSIKIDDLLSTLSTQSQNLISCSYKLYFDINNSPKNASGNVVSFDAYHNLIFNGIFSSNNPFTFSGLIAVGGNN